MDTGTSMANLSYNPFVLQIFQISRGSLFDAIRYLLIVAVRYSPVCLQVRNRFLLPLVQVENGQDFIRQPVAPEGRYKDTAPFLEIRRWKTDFRATFNHVQCAAPSLFDIAGKIEGFGNQNVAQ